jgi:hypothetical protein
MADPIPPSGSELPTVIGPAGLVPTPPLTLREEVVSGVSATNPGFSGNLPGSLVEDIVSTDVQSLVLADLARVETVNSLTPFGCNAFILAELGEVYGVVPGTASNTSVLVVFSGLPGFVIGKGFIVSDGNFQYALRDGGIIGQSGQSDPLFALATQAGSFSVPPGVVTQLITPPPTGFTLTVVNPEAGVPGTDAETESMYRARVLQAGLAASQGMPRYLRTLLENVPGVQSRLIGIQQQPGPAGGWMIIVGGGDPYDVANAIYTALFDISNLVGSTVSVTNITNANPAVVTTDLNHGYLVGQPITLAGVNPVGFNGNHAILAVPSEKTFQLGTAYPANQLASLAWAAGVATATTLVAHNVTPGSTFALAGSTPAGWNGTFVATTASGTTITFPLATNPGAETVLGQLQAGIANFDSTGLPAYVSGGVVTPNNRNLAVTITDYPDTYVVNFVVPPQQTVTMTVTWNTDSPNFISAAAIAQLAAPALADYVNSVIVGQPLNVLVMEDVFQTAVENVLGPTFISVLTFAVSINGIGTLPSAGTFLIFGDPQSYFFTSTSQISVVQG